MIMKKAVSGCLPPRSFSGGKALARHELPPPSGPDTRAGSQKITNSPYLPTVQYRPDIPTQARAAYPARVSRGPATRHDFMSLHPETIVDKGFVPETVSFPKVSRSGYAAQRWRQRSVTQFHVVSPAESVRYYRNYPLTVFHVVVLSCRRSHSAGDVHAC